MRAGDANSSPEATSLPLPSKLTAQVVTCYGTGSNVKTWTILECELPKTWPHDATGNTGKNFPSASE